MTFHYLKFLMPFSMHHLPVIYMQSEALYGPRVWFKQGPNKSLCSVKPLIEVHPANACYISSRINIILATLSQHCVKALAVRMAAESMVLVSGSIQALSSLESPSKFRGHEVKSDLV